MHKYDDDKGFCRREINALQTENNDLEKELHKYQQNSTALAASRKSFSLSETSSPVRGDENKRAAASNSLQPSPRSASMSMSHNPMRKLDHKVYL